MENEELKCLQADDNQTADTLHSKITVSRYSDDFPQDNDERGQWSNKMEFFLAIMGYTVGIGSVWRFPIICSRNGGCAFLIPFFFFLITCGGPLYYLEVCLGQFTGKSAGLSFEFCPLLKGLGFLQVALSTMVIWYVISIMSWVYYYLFSSFFSTLPWTTCDNTWNSDNCIADSISSKLNTVDNASVANISDIIYNTTSATGLSSLNASLPILNNATVRVYQSAAFEFWEYKVIGRSSGFDDMGSLQLHLIVCYFLAWTFCVLAVIKGVKTLGKVVYFTATSPFIFLTIICVRGLMLDGSTDGIKRFLKPDFSKLFNVQVWLEAATQVFYSLGPTWGGVITMASYNKFHQKSFWASTMCVACSGFTSFFNGFVVFTILGFMAKESGLSVEEVASQMGPGLMFVVFPTALAKMPIPQFWSVMFFLMLVMVVFDSLFGMLETVTSGIVDLFPRQLTSRRILVNIVTGLVFFITGLPLTMNGGIYLFQLADWYFPQFALLVGSFFECVAICWIYGTNRFSRDIKVMTGRDVSVLLRYMWTIFIPMFICIAFVMMFSTYSPPTYGNGYFYGSGAIAFGISMGMLPIVGMFAVSAITLVRADGSFLQRLRTSLRPSPKWKPNNALICEKYMEKVYVYPNSFLKRLQQNLGGSKQ